MAAAAELATVAAELAIDGALIHAEPFGRGRIHDSYLLTFDAGASEARYVLQRINDRVFSDPRALMHNVARVTAHVQRKLAAAGDVARARRCLVLVETRSAEPVVRDARGGWWRAYRFIEGSVTCETVADERQAREAARAFGEFQRLVADLPAPRLTETIPDFHVTPRRLEQLEEAVRRDPLGRASTARAEIAAALDRRALADALLRLQRAGALPERITHNDTKLDNVLFDARSGAALCVVDLDTVMPGLAPYDFGDLVRSCAATRADLHDARGVRLELSLFEAILRGYMEGTRGMLTAAERDALPTACQVIAYELGMRFLTDYLLGDAYFKTTRADHNLERARVQLALTEAIEREEVSMRKLVAKLASMRSLS